ncbi:MAG: Por secretion system protein [Bacteroidaceae bacterium]|nr:Por secretion system protein [Bacteroidaceae bacterium]
MPGKIRLHTAFFLSVLTLVIAAEIHAQQIPVDEWQVHLSYHNATSCLNAFGKLYVLSDGSLYSYSPDDNSINTYDKTNYLSDNGIGSIAWCKSEKAIVIGYKNGNIDLLYENDDVYNITDFLNSNVTDKTITDIQVVGKKAYISTAYGPIILNVEKKQIDNSYKLDETPFCSIEYDGRLVCVTRQGTYSGNLSANLLDATNWNKIHRYHFIKLIEFDGKLIGCAGDYNVFIMNPEEGSLKSVIYGIKCISKSDGKLLILDKQNTLYVYSDISHYDKYSLLYCPSAPTDITLADGIYWLSCGNEGILGYKVSGDALLLSKSGIVPDSPRRNYFNYMDFQQDKQRLLAVGGSLNYYGINYEGTVMKYKDSRWSYLDDDIPAKTGLKYINLTSMAEDPEEENHFFVGSARHGLYEFRNDKFIKLHTWNNSGLTTIIPDDPFNYVSVDGLKYDKDGNLWMFNNEVDTIIKILKKDGTWTGLYYPQIKGMPTMKQFLFDSNGLVWANSSRYWPGIFCLDTKGTLENTKDDLFRFTGSKFTNQDGTTVTVNWIYFIEEDLDGMIWIGTDQGIFVIKNPVDFLSSKTEPVIHRLKIPRNDGTGLADYLMSGIYTTSICIDGANRKWIGTMSDGVFLIDSDNQTTIHHFTSENSALLSDYIMSIQINKLTGEVYFGTSAGLSVFGGDATAAEEKLSESHVSAYPNPVLPEHEGKVTVTGLSYQSRVRIISSSGKLVCSGISNGGSFTWNCCGQDGKKVSSGVYHVMVSDKDGDKGIVTNITVIR